MVYHWYSSFSKTMKNCCAHFNTNTSLPKIFVLRCINSNRLSNGLKDKIYLEITEIYRFLWIQYCNSLKCVTMSWKLFLVWTSMALFGLVWPCLAFYSLKWHFMVFYGRISSFLVVIDPNSFGLTIFWCSLMLFDVLWCSLMPF